MNVFRLRDQLVGDYSRYVQCECPFRDLLKSAGVCRVESVIRPYLEVLA